MVFLCYTNGYVTNKGNISYLLFQYHLLLVQLSTFILLLHIPLLGYENTLMRILLSLGM